MKLIHLSDLHLGKRWKEYSLLAEQSKILDTVLQVIDEEHPDAVLLAGDIYDKTVPSAEAVRLFDGFLSALCARHVQTFVISGNHDSPERIAFGGRVMAAGGVHLSPVYEGNVHPTVLQDAFGDLRVYMLPFVKPSHVRAAFPDAEIESYTDALRVAVSAMGVDTGVRNILVAHQFVTGALPAGSEEMTVGGTENVDAAVFADFDYVALGHIHSAQHCGVRHIRYCGTPLKYSFSEVNDRKSVTVVELFEKGEPPLIRMVPLPQPREARELRGDFATLTSPAFYQGTSYGEDFVRITLTDEEDIPEANARLRLIYHHMLQLQYDNKRTASEALPAGRVDAESKTPAALFAELFLLQNNREMSEQQRQHVAALLEGIEEELS